jgi:uncharacterized repeat protein (TIGR01451 family)
MRKSTLHKANRPLAILLAVFVVTFLTSFAAASANMYLLKTAYPTTYSTVGENITYTYTVINTGDEDLTGNFTVTDDHISGPINIPNSDLKHPESVSASVIYAITPTDLNNGYVTNSAYATNNDLKSNTNFVTIKAVPRCGNTCGCNTCGGQSRDGSDGGKGFCGQEKGFTAKFKSTDQINEDENTCHTKNIKEKKEYEWQDRNIDEHAMLYKPVYSDVLKEERWGIHQK